MVALHGLPLSLLLLTFTSPLLRVHAAKPHKGCIHTGDEKEINRILDYGQSSRRSDRVSCVVADCCLWSGCLLGSGGRGTQVALCPRSMFRLQSPILFTAEDQAIYTEGYPTDDSRAMLIVEGQNQSMAIK